MKETFSTVCHMLFDSVLRAAFYLSRGSSCGVCFFSIKLSFQFFSHWAKIFRPFNENFLAGVSKETFTFLEEQFDEKQFFGRINSPYILGHWARKSLLFDKVFLQGCQTCFLRGQIRFLGVFYFNFFQRFRTKRKRFPAVFWKKCSAGLSKLNSTFPEDHRKAEKILRVRTKAYGRSIKENILHVQGRFWGKLFFITVKKIFIVFEHWASIVVAF